jgi:hypothetical protein
MIWQASVEWTAVNPPGAAVEDVMDDLTDALASRGGAIGYTGATGTYSATLTIDAATLRQASSVALSAATAAAGAAGQARVVHQAVEVVTDAEADRRLLAPVVPEVVDTRDAAGILGVTRQRAQQLATTDPRFPVPVFTVGGAPVWVRAAVEAYAAVRDPKPGRRRTA